MEGPPGLDLHEETEALRAQYLQQLEKGMLFPKLQFELASLLSCSPRKANLREATDLLTELLDIGFSRTDCLFQLALVHLKLGEYSLAKRRVETLLRMGLVGIKEPRNLSALSLHSLILDRASHDGVIGSLLIGVLAGMGARQRPPMSHPTHWSPQFST
ncbi:mitochondrial fission 1 protein [Cyclospora cayetanensis]|uniref:Mitochondrial fission 1 protein n=1 Tax=Cyclospora cayetanensis TaxID=88456 RepID=A0A6P6RS57_9EIME|nr:mitochondrial fission 1 protein [Cyclospora cayetanensis]